MTKLLAPALVASMCVIFMLDFKLQQALDEAELARDTLAAAECVAPAK